MKSYLNLQVLPVLNWSRERSLWSIINMMVFAGFIFLMGSCTGENTNVDIEIEPGLKLELIVSEPLVIDPVAYAFDAQGHLYVVEDRGYPDPAEGGTPASKEGRIVLLEDRNGDGQYDHRNEFVDGLTYPNGILPWKGGVFVTCAPDIWYFKDTDGDGKADVKEVVLTGFHDTRTAQIRTSHPTLGLDGWVYVSSGLNGGDVYSPLFPDRDTVSYTASDGRFNPETYEFETVGGKSQFGMAFDAWGNRFGVSNRHPIMQVVIEPEYLNRNPYLPYNQTVKNVSKVAAEAVVFPLREVVTTSDYMPNLMGQSHQGTFTAASSTYIYYGKGLPEDHQGNAYICESAQNLVQRQILSQEGAAFRADLAYEDREFMASEEEWFRPVYVNNGPDDGLYVVDMHRKVIDHPSYVPEEVRDKLDFESGKDMGRIYRITSGDYKVSLSDKKWFTAEPSLDEIIQLLDSDTEWDQETAFRLLLERKDINNSAALSELALQSTHPHTRVRALWILHHKGHLDDKTLLQVFKDEESGVREQAVRFSAERAGKNSEIKKALLDASGDPDNHVRFRSALVLGALEGMEVTEALAALIVNDGEDQWMREAVLSGVGDRMYPFLQALQKEEDDKESYALAMRDLGQMFGNGGTIPQCRELAKMMVENAGDKSVSIATILGLAKGISSRPETRGNRDVLAFLMRGMNPKTRTEFRNRIIQAAGKENKNTTRRVAALQLLGYTSEDGTLAVLRSSLEPEELPEIQQAAVQAVVTQASPGGGKLLVSDEVWSGFTPQVRSSVVSAMVSHSVFVPILLESIGEGMVNASDIPSVSRKRLLASKNENIQKQAEVAFSSLEGGDRMKVFEEYKTKLDGSGDPENGKLVFEKSCAVCHTYEGEGGNVGPDLTAIKNQPEEAILMHTVLPNYEVYPTYQTISIETKEGQYIAGWVLSETENSVTLRTAGGADETVLRTAIKSLNNTGQSLMPDGLEQTMGEGEMNDLIAFLKKDSNF